MESSFALGALVLLNEQDAAQLSKIPSIGDVPILSRLFQSRSIQKSKSELVVLVTPRIADPLSRGAQNFQAQSVSELPANAIAESRTAAGDLLKIEIAQF